VRHHEVFEDRKWLGAISYTSGKMSFSYTNHSDTSAPNYQQTLEEAQEIMLSAAKVVTSLLVYLLALSISLLTLSLYLLSICFPAESCSYLRPTSYVCRYTTAMVSLAE